MSTAMIWQTVSTSSDDTERLGQLLGNLLKSPEVIELRSDLGGGKTTFVHGLARGLGSKDLITSPTFTLSRIYKCNDGTELHHYDFYRLDKPGIMTNELSESLKNSKAVTVIEWGDIVKSVLPIEHLGVEFRPVETNADERLIIINYPEPKAALIRRLETAWQAVLS